jgi:hypothetical protein
MPFLESGAMPRPTVHPLRCRCGLLQGVIAQPTRGARGVCYCRDCQAFARFLGPPPGMLDALGGTDITAVRPHRVAFTQGIEQLACMSLSPRGTLRWYAACCRTPIDNMPRDWRLPHVGLVHSALEGPDAASLDASFGPVRLRVNRHGASGVAPRAAVLTTARAIAAFLGSIALTWLTGRYRRTPFFDAQGRPRVAPRVLDELERAAAYARA